MWGWRIVGAEESVAAALLCDETVRQASSERHGSGGRGVRPEMQHQDALA